MESTKLAQISLSLTIHSEGHVDARQLVQQLGEPFSSFAKQNILKNKNGKFHAYTFETEFWDFQQILINETAKSKKKWEKETLEKDLKEKTNAIAELLGLNEDLEKKLKNLTDTCETQRKKLANQENMSNLDSFFNKHTTDHLHLFDENLQLEQEIKILLKEKSMFEKEKSMLEKEKFKYEKENQNLYKALFNAYDYYAGFTSRIVLDSFYDFFLEAHAKLECNEHSNLFHDDLKTVPNKREISTHWKVCSKLGADKKGFYQKFTSSLININGILNDYVHKKKIKEIIIPSVLTCCESELLVDIFELEKSSLDKKLNGNISEPLEYLILDKYSNEKEQAENFYFLKSLQIKNK